MKNQKFRARKGATFIEYALLAGLVAIVVATAAVIFGDDIKGLFTSTAEQTQKVDEKVKGVDLTKGFENKNNNNNNNQPSNP